MKRLLIASDTFLPRWDGVSRFLNEVIPRLSPHFEIRVLAPDFRGEFAGYPDVEVIRCPLSGFKFADYQLPKLQNRLVSDAVDWADVVWTQTIGPVGSLAILAASRKKKPVIAYIHSIEWELFPRSLRTFHAAKWLVHKSSVFISRFLYNKCNLLLVPSEDVSRLLEAKGIRTVKKVVRLGVDTKLFNQPDSKAAAKMALGIDGKRLVVGFAGRIGLEKDLMTLYRAFGRVNRKYDCVLLIAGQDLAGVTERFRQSSKVRIFGSTNNIAPYFQAMDVYVLSSLTETSSLSTMEAMSCGLAVLVTPVGSVKEYVTDGYNGLFFPKQDAYQLAKKLDQLLADEILRKRLGQNARLAIVSRFSWQKTVDELRSVFERV